ncbi:MAG: hypothetical protein JO300_00635 [Silvibacterium sp.]|nr:hypothetical protein [Silvibacterium sp.]MBV8438354.1 hypothetical protein [Silvibacterium sp.]
MKGLAVFLAGFLAEVLLTSQQQSPVFELAVDVDDLMSPTVFNRRIRLHSRPSQPVSKGFPQRPI